MLRKSGWHLAKTGGLVMALLGLATFPIVHLETVHGESEVSEEGSKLERRTLLVLGDSLAEGHGVGKEAAFPGLLQEKIRQADLPYDVVNAGVSGDTTAGGLRRLNWLLQRPVDVLLVELGGNDGLRGIPLATTRSNLLMIVERARAKNPDMVIVLAGMQMPSNLGEEYTTSFRNLFPQVAEEAEIALVPFLLEGVGGNPRYNQPDLIHPTREGHAIVAENVWRVLEPLLREKITGKRQ